MAKRTFGYVTLGSAGTAQPVYGANTSAVTISVGQTAIPLVSGGGKFFKAGDYCLLDPAGSNPELLSVVSVATDTLTTSPAQFSHAVSVPAVLSLACQTIYIQCQPANVGIIAIGVSTVVESTGVGAIALLQPFGAAVQPIEFTDSINSSTNAMRTSDYWFDGAHTGDKILPSCNVL